MSPKSLNVLYVNHYDRPIDAAATSSYEVISGLASIGHKVVALTHDPYALDYDIDYGSKVERVVLHFPRFVETSRFLKFLRCNIAYLFVFLAGLKVSKEEKIDCIFSQHHNFHFATLSAHFLSVLLDLPYIVKIQDGLPWIKAEVGGPLVRAYSCHVMKTLNKYALRRAKYVLTQSRELKSLLTKIFQIPSERVIIVPNTIGNFSAEPERIEDMKRQLGLQNNRILVFVGSAKKGRISRVEVMIRALPKIASKVPNVMLLLVTDGSDRKDLETLAASLGVEKHIRFTGLVDHSVVPVLISFSDVGIADLNSFLSTIGAVPRKVLEYMACGKPVLSCYGGISQDLLIHGYTGILVRCGDIDEVASAVLNILQDKKLAREIGDNAKEHVAKFYGHEMLAKKLISLMSIISNDRFAIQRS